MDNQRVMDLHQQGYGYRTIANMTGFNKNTIQSYIQRENGRAAMRGEKLERGVPAKATVASQEPRRATPSATATSGGGDIKAALLAALRKPNGLDKEQFTTQHNISPRILEAHIADLRDGGLLVEAMDGKYRIAKMVMPPEKPVEVPWNGDKIIRFGAMGDTQFGSKDQQLTALHRMYDIYAAEGISTVYHTGDMTDGEKMRKGHEYELFLHGADAQEDYTIEHYPRRPGIRTKFILGNHDASHIKNGGHDIGRVIDRARDDMEYLGMSDAQVLITPNCTLELFHPEDGSAYALSYAPQKIMDALPGGEKPSILICGHYHKAEYLFYRNVHFLQTACFQWQTRWMKTHKIGAYVGGWICEVRVSDDGTIQAFKPEYFPVYRRKEEDY